MKKEYLFVVLVATILIAVDFLNTFRIQEKINILQIQKRRTFLKIQETINNLQWQKINLENEGIFDTKYEYRIFFSGQYLYPTIIKNNEIEGFVANFPTKLNLSDASKITKIKFSIRSNRKNHIFFLRENENINEDSSYTSFVESIERRMYPSVLTLEIEGFKYLITNIYSCGGVTNIVQEYLHVKTGMVFVLIPEGNVTIKGNDVRIEPFLMSKTEVTQKIWKKIMGGNTSRWKNNNNPVEAVPWTDAHDFVIKTGLQLPTEVQWEYACRAGTLTTYYWGNTIKKANKYAWWMKNAKKPHPVGELKPNAFGLYDMIGNVYEWCKDEPKDSKGSGKNHIIRGGCYHKAYPSNTLESSHSHENNGHQAFIGVRVCFNFK
ncbi:formylglycine-generating enzyme family protein [Candidatus Uabimicrobium sp. HlEnr_7]|uniref:formylglycine-generating enzyme family protein n=1 Tax=Candidatus Uabimicrobium helgolandensis TaxID=3095367 RepID=UPI003556859A